MNEISATQKAEFLSLAKILSAFDFNSIRRRHPQAKCGSTIE